MSNYIHTWKALNRLNDNSGDDADVRADGTAIRSLSDVGYSLILGWNDDMKAYFEKQEAEEEEMLEKELSEEEDEEENDDD
jgi:hypothetical protein